MLTTAEVQTVIDKMNEAVAMDKSALDTLTQTLHLCNDDFAENSIFFTFAKDEMIGKPLILGECNTTNFGGISAMGFLNGILKQMGIPRIAVMREEDGSFIKFCLFTGD